MNSSGARKPSSWSPHNHNSDPIASNGGALIHPKNVINKSAIRNLNQFRYEKFKQAKMKLSTIFLAGLTSAAETDETAISNLENMETIQREMFYTLWYSEGNHYAYERWMPLRKWDRKFGRTFVRLRRSFDRCGTRDGEENEEIHVENDLENPCRFFNQLLNGFSIWTDRYIASCNGQKKKSHHKKRLKKWVILLNEGKGLNSNRSQLRPGR